VTRLKIFRNGPLDRSVVGDDQYRGELGIRLRFCRVSIPTAAVSVLYHRKNRIAIFFYRKLRETLRRTAVSTTPMISRLNNYHSNTLYKFQIDRSSHVVDAPSFHLYDAGFERLGFGAVVRDINGRDFQPTL
jgi:hypothetical protein